MPFVHPDKVQKYILNSEHPQGAAKARFFLKIGFGVEKPMILEAALLRHSETARLIKQEPHVDGTLLIYECALDAPTGPQCIRTVWLAEQEGQIRLITAYPFF